MNEEEAREILGLESPHFSDAELREAYRAKAREVHASQGDLTSLNIARDILDDALARNRLPAVVDSNTALVALVRSQAKALLEQAASEKLSAGVRSAFVRLSRRDRHLRESAAFMGLLSGAFAFLVSNVNLSEILANTLEPSNALNRQILPVVFQLMFWIMTAALGMMAFLAHRRVERVENSREDVSRQLRRVTNRRQILGRIFRERESLWAEDFRESLVGELVLQLRHNRIPEPDAVADGLAADFEDYLIETGDVQLSSGVDGGISVSRGREPD
ncbi:MAG: hypothetical protein K2P70_06700 [Hyphomonadaceae bacterium]|nr:hypothetical protein [Hyphomonadaceae bacterium]